MSALKKVTNPGQITFLKIFICTCSQRTASTPPMLFFDNPLSFLNNKFPLISTSFEDGYVSLLGNRGTHVHSMLERFCVHWDKRVEAGTQVWKTERGSWRLGKMGKLGLHIPRPDPSIVTTCCHNFKNIRDVRGSAHTAESFIHSSESEWTTNPVCYQHPWSARVLVSAFVIHSLFLYFSNHLPVWEGWADSCTRSQCSAKKIIDANFFTWKKMCIYYFFKWTYPLIQ